MKKIAKNLPVVIAIGVILIGLAMFVTGTI